VRSAVDLGADGELDPGRAGSVDPGAQDVD